jgi:quercetin dioxygenase-like cupin family protein
MFVIKTGSTTSFGVVAAAAALLSALATWGATTLVAPSAAQTAAGGPRQLLTQALGDLPGREVRILIVDQGPDASTARHRHPGHHTFGYVLEGMVEFAIDGQPSVIKKAGDTFYEPPTAVHTTSRNPSTDKRSKVLVFMVADQKNPTTVFE